MTTPAPGRPETAAPPRAGGPPPGDPAWCGLCGESLAAGDHTRCRSALALEPPRYCPACRRRMKVQVAPRGWSATCVEHGTRTG